jgi:hypothetical protein
VKINEKFKTGLKKWKKSRHLYADIMKSWEVLEMNRVWLAFLNKEIINEKTREKIKHYFVYTVTIY